MLVALDHAVVVVEDLERAARRTEALLGRPASWRGEHPAAGTANVLFRLENTYLELLAPGAEGPLGAAIARRLESRGEGLAALAFATRDAAACAEAWRAAGLAFRGPEDGLGRDTESGAIRRWVSLTLDATSSRGVGLFAIEHRSPPDVLPLCEPRVAPASAVTRLDHVVVLAPDLDASARLYREQLGLRLALDRTFEERGVRICFFRVGGTTVELAGGVAGAAEPGAPDRFGGLAWQVADAAAARERLAAAGLDVSEVRDGAKPGTRVFHLRGQASGVPTLFIQPAG